MIDKSRNKKAKRKIWIESTLVFFVAISPFIYKIYDYLPENPEATISFLGMTIDNNGFPDVSFYVWFLLSKFIPLYLLIFWFLTSKNWWYHIILIPIAMYAFQLFEVIFDADDNIDTENIWWLLPICMVVIPFVYFIRIKLYDRYVHGIDLEAMEAELHSLKQKRLKQQNAEVKKTDLPKVEYRSLSEWLNEELSTQKLAQRFKKIKKGLKAIAFFKF
ncbi:hypothetical protein FEE95_13240 [Maribacter algarum]|uniref:Uncharacterized protein n=1 Tax=Maribacter algarum (ex Zhang et al. 2020) TaxID=2578118 RepID=A0A5S3PRY9_9FLAO|nr:hypothetical protein [Maribacter algarum]TMM57444.1 hypothetical protein FEE95_13240 [Maribacter algarum]